MSPSERWLPVVGYEGLYEVSDMGFVRRLVFVNGNTNKPYAHPRVLKRNKVSTGYLSVDLCKDNTVTKHAIHRMVLTAFVGPCPTGMIAAHGNGNPTDPRLANLRWATWSENETDKFLHGTDTRGQKNPAAKITEDDVLAIREWRRFGGSLADIGAMFGISRTQVCAIARGRSWKHVAIGKVIHME